MKGKNKPNEPRGHVFDGILEYDNDLPRWWVMLFFITIVFSGGYMLWFHTELFPGRSLEAEYAEVLAQSREASAAAAAKAAAQGFNLASAAQDAAAVASGLETFKMNCAPCHGDKGQGGVGPNLTDDFWIYGSSGASLEALVTNGALDKGMPGWGEVLGREKIRHLLAFIFTLRGSNPPDAKAAQGDPGKLQ